MIWTGLLTFTVNYALVFWGETHISSGLAAVLYTTFPMIGMLLAHWMLKDEPLTARSVMGVLLAAAGVGSIFYNEVDLPSSSRATFCSQGTQNSLWSDATLIIAPPLPRRTLSCWLTGLSTFDAAIAPRSVPDSKHRPGQWQSPGRTRFEAARHTSEGPP
jgi:hypothetical protein